LNEEMQATNEELETLNEELQATVEELNTTNDELEARTRELQTMVTSQEEKRLLGEQQSKDLAAILNSLPVAVTAVDEDGNTIFENDAYRKANLPALNRLKFSTDGKELSLEKFLTTWRRKDGQWTAANAKRQYRIQPREISGDGIPGTLLVFTLE
jgi:transcriptional regulator with PAS, ATPase and Fis domain